jgi:hypothetical protein
MGADGDALPLSCVACVGLTVSHRGGVCVCVFACCALFLYVRIAVIAWWIGLMVL